MGWYGLCRGSVPALLVLMLHLAAADLNGSVVVFSAGLGGVPNYRIPAIVQTTGSPPALVAFAEARNGSDDSASRIAARTSTDAGETWSPVIFAAGVYVRGVYVRGVYVRPYCSHAG